MADKLTKGQTWARVWNTVRQEMTGLRTLRLYIRQFSWQLGNLSGKTERTVLEPLAQLRGLQDFQLWYMYEQVHSPLGGL